MTSHGLTPEQVRELVAQARADQGLPPKVEDPVTLDLLGSMVALALEERAA